MRSGKLSHRLIVCVLCMTLLLQTPGLVWSAPATRTQPAPIAATIGDLTRFPAQRATGEQPAALIDPLTISRVQSRSQSGGPVTVTYTLHNNLIPTLVPQIADSADITATVAALTAFDPAADMNSFHDVLLTATLAAGVTLVDSAAAPTQSGGDLRWTLPAIPPGSSHTFTLTVQPPAAAADFVLLDDGVTVSARLWDTTISASARPAQLAPDAIPAETLQATTDVEIFDADMLWFAAGFAQDPLDAFAAVQKMGYEPYRGSLRGTRGTLWSAAGNSVDKATLLIALLRAAGIPARYRQGTLSEADAKTLLASTFAAPAGLAGYRPAAADVADPVNDAALIAIARDHWWVEANLPGQGWTNLDPTFPGATQGQSFATPGPQDGVVALPAEWQHTITLALTVEQYTAFPLNGTFLRQFSPLFGTFPTAQAAGKRLIFGQFVEDSGMGGAVFGSRQIVYQPYFAIEDNNAAILGDPFQDLLSSFPLSTQATVAVWIDYTITDLDGHSESFRRPVKDLIGPDVRKNGGSPDIAIDASNGPPFMQPDEQYVHWVLPNDVPEWAYRRQASKLLATVLEIGRTGQDLLDMIPELGDSYTAEQNDILLSAAGLYLSSQREQLAISGLEFAWQTDSLLANLEDGLRTELFYSAPRLFAIGAALDEGGVLIATADLRTTRITPIVHPGQSTRAALTAQWIKGVVEAHFEGAVLERITGNSAVSAARIFAEMDAAGIEPVLFQPEDIDLLANYPYSAAGKAYMVDALSAGKRILAPARPVEIDGVPQLAWWQVDPVTGETVSVGENGLHPSSFEWIVIKSLAEKLLIQLMEFLLDKILGAISGGWLGGPMSPLAMTQFIQLLTKVGEGLNDTFMLLAAALGGTARAAAVDDVPDLAWAFLPAHLCPVDNCGVEQFLLPGGTGAPVPLPEVHFAYAPAAAPTPYAGTLIASASSLPAGTPALQLSTAGSSTTAPGQPVAVAVSLAANVAAPFATLAYVPAGWTVTWSDANQISVTPPVTAPAGNHTILLVTQAQAQPDLVRAAQHTVTVSAAPPLTLAAAAEPNITVPVGAAFFADVSNQTNDGETEIPNAAYRLSLTNGSAQAQTVNVTVSGAPTDWLLLNGVRQNSAVVVVPAHSRTDVGLYVSPTTPAAPGTGFGLSVQATSAAGSANASLSWNLASQAFNFVEVDPETIYLAPNGSVDFAVAFTNVGNSGGDFPLRAALPGAGWTLTSLPSSLGLSVGERRSTTATLTAAEDAVLGQRYRLILAGDAPNSYSQYALADVQVISAQSGLLTAAANRCTLTDSLDAALTALAQAVIELEYWCTSGDCPDPLRDQAADAADRVVDYARSATLPTVLPTLAAVDAAAASLRSQNGDDNILAAVAVLADSVDDLSAELCQVDAHRSRARFTPYVNAVQLGDSASFNLDVTNQGTVTTTYAITVTGLPGADLTFNESIAPGVTRSLPVNVTPSALGIVDLAATVAPVVPALTLDLKRNAVARLTVVDKFVQVTQVIANPDFVESGVSATNLSVEVANLSGVPQAALATARILAADGSVRFNQAGIAVNVLAGNPRTYALTGVDTSGWADGVYTVTVDLRDAAGELIPDGSGYGYFSVGQGLQIRQAVAPEIVAPGTLTVTTFLTSEISGASVQASGFQALRNTIYDAPNWQESEEEIAANPNPANLYLPAIQRENAVALAEEEVPAPRAVLAADATTISPGLVRYEESDAGISYAGAWSATALPFYSGQAARRSESVGATATFTFTGVWLEIGLGETIDGGKVEVTLDNVSQGIFDLYGRYENRALIFDNLSNAQHVVRLTVVDQDNPFTNRNWVALDYLTVWDGTALPSGTFEHTDARVLNSNGWTNVVSANASGGNYGQRTAKAWFYFEGDSVGVQIVTNSARDEMRLSVDGQFVTKYDLQRSRAVTDTLSLNGFGPGLHVLELDEYRGGSVLDVFVTPGVAPFFVPPTPAGYTRFEEDDPALRYNGVTFGSTDTSWSMGAHIQGSNSFAAVSSALSDTVSLTFTGTTLFLGFYTSEFSGLAQVTIDGVSRGIVDTYSNDAALLTKRYAGLAPGQHTVTVTVLNQRNPYSTRNDVRLDFIDVWDGTGLANGTAQAEDRARVYISENWGVLNNAGASAGRYLDNGSTVWFPFNGDSVSLIVPRFLAGNDMRLFVDERFVGFVENDSPTFITETVSFNGFGAGAHLLRLEAYRLNGYADAFVTPGVAPFVNPNPPVVGITRYEEDHPSIRYNGVPLTQTAQSWVRTYSVFSARASRGQHVSTTAANDTVSFTFTGTWLGVGFTTDETSGQAEIAIDGNVVATVDLFTRGDDTHSVYFDNLTAGAHTVTVKVLGTRHPNATNSRVYIDYFDVWDGQPLAQGSFEQTADRIFYSESWGQTNDVNASGGNFAESSANVTAWFPFTGDSVTFQALTRNNYHTLELRVDGESKGLFNAYSRTPGPRSFSFSGLGSGPHMLEVRAYRNPLGVDRFVTPSTGEHYTLPAPGGVLRLEEDHPDLRYNGHPFRTMPATWATQFSFSGGSGSYNTTTSTAGNSVSLDFEGRWVGVGFINGGVAEIFIDGVSRGTFDTATGAGGVSSIYYDDLITGTHTISVTRVSGALNLDFIDIWDGQPTGDGWHNADLEDYSGRFHFTNKNWWVRTAEYYAYDGDYLNNFPSANINVWFTFSGDGLSILGHERANTELHVFIDGVDQGTFDMTPQFSEQPKALHFPDLGEGPHVAQVFLRALGGLVPRIDAFNASPDNFFDYTPKVNWYDFTAQESLTTTLGTGFASTIAIGDLNGDGAVELVAPSLNGRLYVYRGDGGQNGNTSPILWTSDLVGVAAEPALADLNGDGKAEIIVSGQKGTAAFTHSGGLLWHNPNVISYYPNEKLGWGGPSIGNLDLDPEPEIVIAASDDALYVLDHLGNVTFSDPVGVWPTVPVLADISGDGVLDVIVAQGWDLTVYDVFNGGQIVWSRTLPDPINVLGGAGVFGAPAVADLDDDGRPEVILNWGHIIEALRDDGTVFWRYLTNNTQIFRPSPITVADVTGDGKVDVITASALRAGFNIFNHQLMVIDRAGNLVWQQLVADNTASASGVAAQDLTGDGVWEILWNGATDGFLVIRGNDGRRLFNEPVTGSGTVLDYPSLGDVDGDGNAEVVVSGREGIFVIGHDGLWADSRPLWNQHNYHITNINDDWSVLVNEPNSWDLHNTYRTQTPDRTPAPSYQVAVTYTAGLSNVTVLTQTASISLTSTPPTHTWTYRQDWLEPLITHRFDSRLTNLQPGETRQVSAGTQVAYRLPSGFNVLTLPPLYVTAANLAELTPPTQSVVIGGRAVFTLTLTNPSAIADIFTPTISGIPAAWLSAPGSVTVAAGQSVRLPISVTVPSTAEADVLPLIVDVSTAGGGAQGGAQSGAQSVQAALTVFAGVTVSIAPTVRSSAPGVPVTYTLAISNAESVTRTYGLSGSSIVDLPATAQVGPNTMRTFTVTAASNVPGPQPFTVTATAASGATGAADAVLDVATGATAALRLSPDPLVAGPGSTAVFALIVTNRGDQAESFDLAVDLPAGWSHTLQLFGRDVVSVTLPPAVFNSVELALLVTPSVGATVGNYPVTARASVDGVPAGSTTATVALVNRGVQIEFVGGPGSIDPRDGGAWDVRVTNRGQVADSFGLGVDGPMAGAASFTASSVTLDPGTSQTVQLRLGNLGSVAPGNFPLGVTATSQANNQIKDSAITSFSTDGYEALVVEWAQPSQSVQESLEAHFTLNVFNNGSVSSLYTVALDAGDASVTTPLTQIQLPAGSVAQLPVTVFAPQGGDYTVIATVTSSAASGSAAAAVSFSVTAKLITYLPLVTVNQTGAQPGGEEKLYLPFVGK